MKNKYTIAHIGAKRFTSEEESVEAAKEAQKNDPNIAGWFADSVVTIVLKPGAEIEALGMKWNQVFLAK